MHPVWPVQVSAKTLIVPDTRVRVTSRIGSTKYALTPPRGVRDEIVGTSDVLVSGVDGS